MATGEGSSPLRVGNAERTAALKALDEHLEAGRLGVEEYADRTAAAANAVVAADLAALFTDLPEPHPPLPTGPATTAPLPVTPPPDGTLASWGPRLMPLAVIATIALFLVTRQGAVFVLIPLAAGLLWFSRR
jgi:uncharacterized protein DUF1707